MSHISLKSVINGDVLEDDIIVYGVTLFETGTVLTSQRVEVLEKLGVTHVSIESRQPMSYDSLQDAFDNIDARFSYVESNPFMKKLKTWVRDVLCEIGGCHE